MNNTHRDTALPLPERIGEVVAIGGLMLLAAVFIYHQVAATGFFTEEFDLVGMLALYIPLLAGVMAPAVRAMTGSRWAGLPFEAVTSLLLAAGSLWLLRVFPLDYTHLADFLPVGVRWTLAWVTDDIAKMILRLQVILGPIAAAVNLWKFVSRQ